MKKVNNLQDAIRAYSKALARFSNYPGSYLSCGGTLKIRYKTHRLFQKQEKAKKEILTFITGNNNELEIAAIDFFKASENVSICPTLILRDGRDDRAAILMGKLENARKRMFILAGMEEYIMEDEMNNDYIYFIEVCDYESCWYVSMWTNKDIAKNHYEKYKLKKKNHEQVKRWGKRKLDSEEWIGEYFE